MLKSTTHWLSACYPKNMILLVTRTLSAPICVDALQKATGEPVTIAQGLSEALANVRSSSFSLVLLDRNLIEAEPHEATTLRAHLELSIVLEINLGLTALNRLIEEVQSARQRYEHNLAAARISAMHSLHAEVNQTLTALLLECDLATQTKDLPPAASERLAFIRVNAGTLREQLTSRYTN